MESVDAEDNISILQFSLFAQVEFLEWPSDYYNFAIIAQKLDLQLVELMQWIFTYLMTVEIIKFYWSKSVSKVHNARIYVFSKISNAKLME